MFQDIVTHNETIYQKNTNSFAKRIEHVAEQCNRVCDAVSTALLQNYFPIVLSGDHSSALGTISGIKKAHPNKKLGVIWIDAHADMHSPYTSPSGNIHGMPLAAALGLDHAHIQVNKISDDTISHWKDLKSIGTNGPKLTPDNLVYFGLRDFESAEAHIIEKEEVSCYKVEELRFRGLEVCVKEAVEQLQDCDHIYISFDVDSMDCDHVSTGTGTPVPIGFFAEEIVGIFDQLFLSNKLVCIEFTEVNPLLDNKGNLMAETAFMVLDHIAKKI